MWYVLQTQVGKEQELVETIKKLIEHRTYKRCFFVKREVVWRLHGQCRVHREPLYPGYVFVDTDKWQEFYKCVRSLPQSARFPGKIDAQLYPLPQEEEAFLKSLIGEDKEDVIRLSPVNADEQGQLIHCKGAVGKYADCIIKKRLRLRYVVIKVPVAGTAREILLGVRVEEGKNEGFETI